MPRLRDEENRACRAVTFETAGGLREAAAVLRETADWLDAAGNPGVLDIAHSVWLDEYRTGNEQWQTTLYLDDQIVTEAEAAEAAGVTRSRVSQWRREGLLTPVGEPGPVRYWLSDVRAASADSAARDPRGRPRKGATVAE